ncbi:Acg family FMN-binding oxidoreductase [Pseudonocardia oroxyli]|uniref:Nitroreductase family protein n=1 Tax=Pseudonocardia oroxyli TaxID=366584 RepID=A0A1G8E0R9_PSEOR|nr:nitroreductase [Pseudonocardia oroxyli]SDH63350.1 hypothetical protein SAMN05216377_1305 [Pseudonocardia oroxyli]
MIETTATLGLGEPALHDVLRAASRAPSLHNTQPWSFRVSEHAIELWADRTRQLRVADPSGRELRIACGAALLNLRLALLGQGVKPLVSVLPDPTQPDLVAIVRRGGTRRATPAQRRLLEAIPRRHTNRTPFTDGAIASAALHDLRRAALDEGAWLHLVTDPAQRTELSDLARHAHEVQVSDPAFAAELERWTGHDEPRSDGVPAASGGPLPRPNSVWVMRDFTRGNGKPDPGFEADPIIAVLTAHSDGPHEEVRAGEALERVLLTATTHGLSASFLSQLVEVPDARQSLRRMLGGFRPPLVVLRLGHGWPVPTTPRRPYPDLVHTVH